MAVLAWDQVGKRSYQHGIDRGVLYLNDGSVAAWNGLTSVDDGSDSERKSVYLDGVKVIETIAPGSFVGNLKAFTYPDEFDQVIGIEQVAQGLSLHEQPQKSFNLSYRTKVGNDKDPDYGYKIHLLYNLSAIPDTHSFQTSSDQAISPEFSWGLSGTPPIISGHRPTVHISVDSTKTDPSELQALENILYGTVSADPRFPSIGEVEDILTRLELSLQAPDGSIWSVTATSDGTLNVSSSILSTLTIPMLKFKAANNSLWVVTATNSGTLNIASSVLAGPYLEEMRMRTPGFIRWIVTATNDGTLNLEALV